MDILNFIPSFDSFYTSQSTHSVMASQRRQQSAGLQSAVGVRSDLNPSAAGARDLRLLQAATKTLQLDRVRFFGYF